MLIILGFYRRRPDLTAEQFQRHWRDVHGPLIRSLAEQHPKFLRYVQHHLTPDSEFPSVPGVTAETAGGFDGFSEAWFADVAARDAFFDLPQMKNEVIADEREFIDMTATRWVVLDRQHTIIAGAPGLVEDYAAGRIA